MELLGNEVISAIAAAHGKSSAQVILRWNLQKSIVVIPGSGNPDHPVFETSSFCYSSVNPKLCNNICFLSSSSYFFRSI